MKINRYHEDEETKVKFNGTVMKRMLQYLKPFKKTISIVITIQIVCLVLASISPKVIQYLIDRVFPSKIFGLVVILAFLIFFLSLVQQVLSKKTEELMADVENKVIYRIRNDLFDHMQYLSFDYYDKRPHGKIIQRVNEYADSVSHIITNYLFQTVFQILTLLITIVFMFLTNVPLTLIVLLGGLAVTLITIYIAPIMKRLTNDRVNKEANSNAFLLENINGIQIVKQFNREKKNQQNLRKINQERIQLMTTGSKYYNVQWYSYQNLTNLVLAAIYTVGALVLYPDHITVGAIVAMASYSLRFWNPVNYLTNVFNEFVNATVYMEKIFELMDEPIIIKDTDHAKQVDIQGDVEFQDVSFGYEPKNYVLDHLTFHIKPKEKIAIVGETGIGKTTLINLITRFYDVNLGQILIDGINVKDIKLQSLRDQIKIMLQDNYLFSTSILKNIQYGKHDATLEEVKAVCKIVNIDSYIEHLEASYDTKVSNASNLSAGQKQLICLARTILSDPKILILDEATSNIDLKTERDIQKGIDYLMKDRTCFVIAHRLSTIKNCDRIFLIGDKHIKEMGTHNELMKKKGKYYQLYTSQIEE